MSLNGITGRVLKEAYSRIKDNKVVLYPMGDNGIVIKNFLNTVMDIQESGIIDMSLSKYIPSIFSIEEINKIPNFQDCVYLITSNKDCFSRYLIEQGILQANIINPWIRRDELIMNCFIDIISNKAYTKILDYCAFLYDYGQFTKSFYSSSEDKFYYLDNKQFFTNNLIKKFSGFENLYSYSEKADVCIIVIKKTMDRKEIGSIIAEQLQNRIPLFCIAETNLNCNIETPYKMYRFSRLYVYQWEAKG